MNKTNIVYLILVVVGLCYNFQNSSIRLVLMLSWAVIPFFTILSSSSTKIEKRTLNYYYQLFFLTCCLFFSFFYNSSSFELELSGASVEKLTPFIGFMTLPYFFIISNSANYQTSHLRDLSIWLVILFFLFEASYRYIRGPELFMNYFNRHSAKTIGLLSTTNVNGQSLSVLFSCILVINIKHKVKLLTVIFLLLLSTMARAAIIAVILTTIIYLLVNSKAIYRIIALGFSLVITMFFILDPLNLLTDGSFLSKLEFITSTTTILNNADLAEVIFGFGLNYESITNTLGVKGWSPHLPILKGFLYYGIFGVIYFILSNLLIYRLNTKIFFPLSTYLILSFAGAPLFWPGLFSISLITLITKDDYNNLR